MSEHNPNTPSAQEELMRRLKSIGADLWGALPTGNGADRNAGAEGALNPDIEEAWRQERGKPFPSTGKGFASDAGAKTPILKQRRKPGIDNLWFTADETVDWTEALLRDRPADGLTGQKLWSFYHRMAGKVLDGDTAAYAEVLTTLNPLADLTEFVAGMILRTPGPDRVECVFECQKDDLEKYGRDYLGALSLRIARDLLAVLPVSEVLISGNLEGDEKIRVTFRRSQLLKQKMAFLVPADFAEACGGIFTP